MYGRGLPEEMSQYSSTDVPGMRILSSCSAVVITSSVRSSSSFSWAAASALCHWSGDYLNPGKRVRDDDVLAGNVADICGELKDEIQVVKLVWWALVSLLVEGEGERFVVRQDDEMPGLQHVTEIPHNLRSPGAPCLKHCTFAVLGLASWRRRRGAARHLAHPVGGLHPWWWLKHP